MREIFIALCIKVHDIKDPEVTKGHLSEMDKILNDLANDGLINIIPKKPFNFFTITGVGKTLVESWHADDAGKKFKDLQYWG